MAVTSGSEHRFQLLDRYEADWRQRLGSVSLVAEADVDPEESRPVLAALGDVYQMYKRSPEEVKLLAFRHWPACVVVVMTAVAATDYGEGTYWPKLWTAVRYPGSSQDQRIWGSSFRDALAELGLPGFPEASHVYLGPILMHCGVPTHCLRDLLHALADHARRDPGMDADSFMSWVTELPGRISSMDKPVQNLLRDGREYAYDLVDRLIELLDRLRDPDPDLYGIGLPHRLVDKACSLVVQHLITLPPASRRSSGRKFGNKPRLALDPFGDGPLLVLPVLGGAWRVTLDGDPSDVRLSPGSMGEDSPQIRFPLPRPVRHVQVTHLGTAEPPTTITVVRDDDPLLVFSEDGELLPPSQPLPPDAVWVLYREDREFLKGGEARVICEAQVPFGWDRWILREVDLNEVKQLSVSQGHVREVRGAGHPRLVLQDPLPGITGAHHQPVYGTPPVISLPSGELARTWWIELRREGAGNAGASVRMTVQAGDVDPWSELPRPVTGTFEVSILGPLGFRFYRRVCVAEGLSVQYEPAVRLLNRGGLDLAEARIAGPATLSSTRLVFGEDESETTIVYGDTTLHVAPPHLRVLHDNGTTRVRWLARPLRLSAESLAANDPGMLLVRGPATLRIPSLRLVSGGVTQDVYSSGVHRDGHARYQLIQLKDTIAHVRHADLELHMGERIVPLAWVRPDAFAAGAELIGAQIRLAGYRNVPGVKAGLYQVYAPWRGVAVLPVVGDGVVVLPQQLKRPGPIRVYLAALDTSSVWPYWPPADESFLVQAPGRPSSEDDAELTLAAFLAGDGPCPRHVEREWLWLVTTLAERLQADGTREDLRGQCGMCLRADPVASLVALSKARLNPAEAITALIQSGLAALQPIAQLEAEETRNLWTRLPVVAALLAGSVLADPARMPELIDIVATEHDRAAAEILRGESDPLAPIGTDDRQSFAPAALIDISRVRAELERHASYRFTERVPRLVSDAVAVLAQTPYAALASRIGARRDGPLSLSSALALVARATAGNAVLRREFQPKYQLFWSELAESFPDLVSIDIIVAQAAVSGIDRTSTPRGPHEPSPFRGPARS